MTPITPLEPSEMFQRGKSQSFLIPSARSSLERPLSTISTFTDIEDIDDIEEDDDSSDFEEYSYSSSNDNRKSQTTISTFEEVQTPRDDEPREQFAYNWYAPKAVEGPKGPHLFRASQASNDFSFDFALQLSPLLPRETPLSFQTSFREATPDTIVPMKEYNNIASAVAHLDNGQVRAWTSRQVATWMYQNGLDDDIIDRFEAHDITGAVLLDLQFDDLKELEIQSFGKRHQLWNHIDSLRTAEGLMSPAAPVPTPFEDLSRPCTGAGDKNQDRRHRDRSRGLNECDGDDLVTPGGGRRRKARRQRNLGDDLITPAESVSIVAIEQLLPKPHKCAKGERCAKFRKQQRQLARLAEEHGHNLSRFPISPEEGGHIFIAGDPGNAQTANHAVDNFKDVYRPTSDAMPSVVASSDLLGPGELPEFDLEEGMLQRLDQRDPQDNVRQFLSLQGFEQPYTTATPIEAPPTPPLDMFPTRPQIVIPNQPYLQASAFSASTASAHTSRSFEPTYTPNPALHPPEFTPAPHTNLRSLPKLNIPRSMSAQPQHNGARGFALSPAPDTAFSPCRTASPGGIYRFGTPFSEMDVPVTQAPVGPISRDTSQSVPPNMQYRDPVQRSGSRAADWRRSSMQLPALNEGEVFSPTAYSDGSNTLHEIQFGDDSPTSSPIKPMQPAAAVPAKGGFTYEGVGYHGWMKKRRTKLLRHEWQDNHFRLNGTQLSQHANELPSSSALRIIDVDDYAVGCSSLASNKLSAKLRALKISSGHHGKDKNGLPMAFEFQLVPTGSGKGEIKRVLPHGKVHHFAVKSCDDRIDWMRELMLAKALKSKKDGYEVNINGADM
ncbi:hypothetical protein K504DRAFT_476420 [Pleomassaria siparia CBS 279.74]|uniref:SAM and PH domain-containing protein n=1 Tax=Pleomassaria siparia CBS 279.74 TaxID=1314801 RepID=A0A6G1KC35_9PLEO|nr:hypothetical protein K504DRAFT_476420 [Pleomassaria siparia CBS 279.74]